MFIVLAFISLISCNDKYPELGDGIFAEIVTDQGTMVAELFYEDAPATVASFVSLAEGTSKMVDSAHAGKPFYNGLKFHRILKDFMIQGGDPLGVGSGDPGYKFHDEINKNKHDTIGVLSMANSGANTNGSQFFITEKATPWLDEKHTVFGKVRIGIEVIKEISSVPMKDARRGVPKDPVFMNQINIIRQGSAAKAFDAPAVFEEQLRVEVERKAQREAERKLKNKAVVDAFEAKKAKAETLPSGLQIYWEHRGRKAKPAIGTKVNIDYAGYFTDGELFDTSMLSAAEKADKVDLRRKQAGAYRPMQRAYSPEVALVAGFKEALLLMAPGDKLTAFIPSHLGYGERGYPGAIPPNADIIFDIHLIGPVEKK